MRALEGYVDAQNGGPGKGWYRIVTTPTQARKVINAGKLAVVMGIETSVPFGCTQKLGVPDLKCTAATIDKQLDEVRKMGVTQMELVNKFDNALSGVAGDTGRDRRTSSTRPTCSRPARRGGCRPATRTTRRSTTATRTPRRRSTPTSCPPRTRCSAPSPRSPASPCPSLPIYPAKHHCNSLGLTDLGAHTIKGLAKRHMLFDPDHMSVKARKASLDLIDSMKYSGVAVQPLVVDPGRLPADLPGEGLHHAVRRGQQRLRREVEAPPDLGQPEDLLGLRLRRRHQRARRPGRPAARRRDRPPGDLPVHHARAASRSTSRSAASASTTSTRTASRTTGSTRTGSRT